MRKQILSVAVAVTLLLLGFSTADAKKKPEEPARCMWKTQMMLVHRGPPPGRARAYGGVDS